MMPNMDGWDTCYQIRQISNVPIIMLTARNQNYDMVKGLTMGADDYITKPFDEHVLVARIEAILRRTKKDGFVSFNGIEWDKTKHTVTVYDEKISLTPIEFSLLGLFLQNTNRAYSRDDLIEKFGAMKQTSNIERLIRIFAISVINYVKKDFQSRII